MLNRALCFAPLLCSALAHADVRALQKADGSFDSGSKPLDAELLKRYQADLARPSIPGWHCEMALSTTLAVSWTCWGGPGTTQTLERAFQIVNQKLVPLGNMWKPNSEAALEKDLGCPIDLSRPPLYLNVGGFGERKRGQEVEVCLIKWQVAMPYLAPPFDKIGKWAIAEAVRVENYRPPQPDPDPENWVADGADQVVDKTMNLVWAAHDNGADLDFDAATAYAKAYRGGGHDDWRIPTLEELSSLVAKNLAHREPKDCTGGKSNYLITPRIHISCGILWSSDRAGDNVHALGFISGNERTARWTEKTNYRALVVRDAK